MPPDTASGLWDSVPPLIASGDASRVCALLAAHRSNAPLSAIYNLGNGSAAVLTLNNGRSSAEAVVQQTQAQARQQQHQVLGLAPAASLLTAIQPASSTEPVEKVASLEEIESVWLDLRRLQQDITEVCTSLIDQFVVIILS